MVRVGIIDSGPADLRGADAMAFDADGRAVAARPDRLGHGTAVAAMIARACPQAALRHAQVFDDRAVTSALRVAAALDWLVGAGDVDVVGLSLGLAADRAVLAQAVARAVSAGVILVAAHPAQGASPFPAGYPGVIAATGDARCTWDQVSHLRGRLFGTWCNSPEQGGQGMAGASLGAARLTGHVAALVSAGHARDTGAIMATLAKRAAYVGRERRCA
ncbi:MULTISPECIES: S8 family serine peptidase [unclassified Mameliella]|uniref:subtilisin-like serine protease QhpE n=1 Tax=unclassified Mameliella TaxID=2630630 RepID=UPI00273E023A|nr:MULTISPECIES: S8 family serine peptidase [unclassified Mameliella]